MNVLEVNYTDLPGRLFNGFDLHLALNREGIVSRQLVKSKLSDIPTVEQFPFNSLSDYLFKYEETLHSIKNIIYPYAINIVEHNFYKDADIVHYHILHNDVVSLFDYPLLMNNKKTVWTLHDPWIFTGNCIHPFECQKWKTGCGNCNNPEPGFAMRADNTACMWQIKKEILSQINPWIVVASDFMKRFVEASPLTSHWNKIIKIPFGVDVDNYKIEERDSARTSFALSKDDFVIGFRESSYIKGCDFIYEALRKLDNIAIKNIVLMTVGEKDLIPADIKGKYRVIELSWVNDSSKMIYFHLACDLFLMPSLAESFGMMAVEAMAAKTPVVCFKNTVLEEITAASDVGLAVDYKSSDGIANAIVEMLEQPNERERRGDAGRKKVENEYAFSEYVYKHIRLYEQIMTE